MLALDPLIWLIRSWHAPGYDSAGWLVFALVVGVVGWSASSPIVRNARPASSRFPLGLLGLSLVVRLLSQLLAINLLGAMMLAVDLFALAVLLRLSERQRAASPLMLAALFCFAMPIEPMLQRSLGFLLQQLSAAGACGLLSMLHASAGCEGVRLFIDDVDVLVDLPCSGARLLTLVFTGFFTFAAVTPPPASLSRKRSALLVVQGIGVALVIVWFANTLRIALLAWGLRYAGVLGINVMHDPWHSTIGLGIAAGALWAVFRLLQCRQQGAVDRAVYDCDPGVVPAQSKPTLRSARSSEWLRESPFLRLSCALGVLGVAVVLVSLRATPLDVSRAVSMPELPLSLAGVMAAPLPLSELEQDYFATYGGGAARAGYGAHSLLLVQTTSPLRHLHSPEVCFSAAGYAVSYEGADFSSSPTAVYRARSPAGEELRVRVQFVSASGRTAYSVGQVVWHWLSNPVESWTMVQTVSPWNDQSKAAEAFRTAVAQALNLGSTA